MFIPQPDETRQDGQTPAIGFGSYNVSTFALSDSDSESESDSDRLGLADLFSTPVTAPPSTLRVVCAWHEDLSLPVNRGVSHGLCTSCAAKLHAELDAADAVQSTERVIEECARERRAA